MTKMTRVLLTALFVAVLAACSAKPSIDGEYLADVSTMPGGAMLAKHLKISFLFQDGKVFLKAVTGQQTRTKELAYSMNGNEVSITNPEKTDKKVIMILEGNTLKCKECTPGFPTKWTKK